MKKTLITLTVLSMISISCKKEVVEETPAVVTIDNIPTLAVTEPDNNFNVNIGDFFSLEGVANDSESLQTLHYSITSPNASYNYSDSQNFPISGTSKDFNYQIPIPESASIGDAILEVYAVDSENQKSLKIHRNFIINDPINPTRVLLTDSLNNGDSLLIVCQRNLNNIVDSINIYSKTTNQLLGYISDKGGFKQIALSTEEYETSHSTTIIDLRTLQNDSFTYYTTHLPSGSTVYSGNNFNLGVSEFNSPNLEYMPSANFFLGVDLFFSLPIRL